MSIQTNKQTLNEGHTLAKIALAMSQPKTFGPVSPEELAMLSEGTLSEIRKQEVMSAIANDRSLYNQWLNLCELKEIGSTLHEESAKNTRNHTVTQSSPSVFEKVKLWLDGLSFGQLAGASSFGLALGLSIGLINQTGSEQVELASNVLPAQQAEVKANSSTIQFQQVTESSPISTDSFLCDTAPNGTLCISGTRQNQHWFLKEGSELKAITAPFQSNEIFSVTVSDDFSLAAISSHSKNQYSLSVTSIDALKQDHPNVLYTIDSPVTRFKNVRWEQQQLFYSLDDKNQSWSR